MTSHQDDEEIIAGWKTADRTEPGQQGVEDVEVQLTQYY